MERSCDTCRIGRPLCGCSNGVCDDWVSKDRQEAQNRIIQRAQNYSQWEALSLEDQFLLLSLLSQIRGLRKVCPECTGRKSYTQRSSDPYYTGNDETVTCGLCHGTGTLPIEPGDVEVRLK